MDLVAPSWWQVVAPAAGVVGGALLYGAAWPRAQLFGPVLHRAPEDAAPNRFTVFVLGLPSPEQTSSFVQILGERSCPAAFAVTTEQALEQPDLLRDLDDAEHLIVNHGPAFRAAHLFQGYGFWRHALDANDDAVCDAIGSRPRLFCPPAGMKSPVMLREALWGGHAAVAWSRSSHRWLPNRLNENRLGNASAGSVLAVTGADPRSAGLLAAVLDRLLSRGLRAQRLDRLLGVPGYRANREDDDVFSP